MKSDGIHRKAAAIFRAAVSLRAAAYDHGIFRVHKIPGIRVISVGGLAMGGSGKTPFSIFLAERLLEQGNRPAVVLRGYKGRMETKGGIVSEGNGPLVHVDIAGDEAYLIAKRTRGIPVVVGADRIRAVTIARDLGANVAVLDDGFSHRRLHRDLDILLTTPSELEGGDAMFPYGALRESPSAAKRAHLVGGFAEAWGNHPSDFTVAYVPSAIVGENGETQALDAVPRKVHLLAGIARPERFFSTAKAEGFECVSSSIFRDHHRFTREELKTVFSQAAANGAEALLTTEKDFVRIPQTADPLPIFALRVEVRLCTGEARLIEAINGAR